MGHLAHPARARPEKKSPAGGDRVAGPALRVEPGPGVDPRMDGPDGERGATIAAIRA